MGGSLHDECDNRNSVEPASANVYHNLRGISARVRILAFADAHWLIVAVRWSSLKCGYRRELNMIRKFVFVLSWWLASAAVAQDVSSPAFLQMFEARWSTIEDRMVDIFKAGYGGMWLPPPAKADSGGLSVGYDVFDRFHLGKPRDETLYGTETGIRTVIDTAHRAGVNIYTDFLLNHNGFRDSSTPDFVGEGDYPGFVTTLPNDIDGDFHSAFATGEIDFRLSGLIDIAQEKNHQFIRHPVDPSDPANIPTGSIYDVATPDNARFYPDRDLGGQQVWDPRLNQNVTLYDYNRSDPLQGDAVTDNATGLLMRSLRWMVQEIGVDGFRLDAARHFDRWVLNYYDQAVYLAKPEPLLDGSVDHVFSFSETGYDNDSFLQEFVRKDIDPNNLNQVSGNRDALDFNLFGAIKNNLTDNGLANDWRSIKNTSLDRNDDGYANNGSQGVAFVKSHDEIGAYLDNVAHAYMLMRPGNANVYLNAKEFGDNRDFPRDGRGDALGGLYGDAVTRLVQLRNSHGRGNYLDRTPSADEKSMLIYEREKSALVILSNRLDSGFDARTVQTSFAPGTPLIELTGNAENAVIDPFDDFPSVVVVNADGTADIRVPRNRAPGDGDEHGSGYLIYGVSGPQGRMRLTDAAGIDLSTVLPGGSPTSATNGTTRINDVFVVTQDSMKVRLETDAVQLLGSIRDRHADGDFAVVRVDGGIDVNDQPGVDYVTPYSHTYGFEDFRDINQPGFFQSDGEGLYEQTVDTSQLSEGLHYITSRAYRHRNSSTTTGDDPNLYGDGGPAVFTDFREAIYVDRLPPESAIESFDPYGFDYQRDLVVRSLDRTADAMHVFVNLPAEGPTDEDLHARALNGQNRMGDYDRDQFIYGIPVVRSGNSVVTVVTIEPTGNYSVQRFPGLFAETEIGLGFGDMNWNNVWSPEDLAGTAYGFEAVLYSQNTLFNPAADVTGDGLVDNRDLFALGAHLFQAGVSEAMWTAFDQLLLRRGDVNQDGMTDASDIDHLYANLGADSWLLDLNSDGIVDQSDVFSLVTDVFRTLMGDANLDGAVDASDLGLWNSGKFSSDVGWAGGDFNGDGVGDISDYAIWSANKFQFGTGYHQIVPVPEPQSMALMGLGAVVMMLWCRNTPAGMLPHMKESKTH